MATEKKPHFGIPDEEVERIEKEPRGRTTPRAVLYSEHGVKLSSGLKAIKESLEEHHEDDSLADSDVCVFRVDLPIGEKIQHKANILNASGIQINAVKTESSAIVSTSKEIFSQLRKKVEKYTESGINKTTFDYIDSFSPYMGTEKNSNALMKTISSVTTPDKIDIQLMFIPNLGENTYTNALRKLLERIQQHHGEIQQEPYWLSDNTPVVRVIIPSSSLPHYENDSAIYRIEETNFFRSNERGLDSISLDDLFLKDKVSLSTLPIVAVLDSGVQFPANLSAIVIEHWHPGSVSPGDAKHGTSVAGCVAFGYIGKQLANGKAVQPRARIIDCNILSENVPENILIRRIQESVNRYSDVAKIFNLSANANNPIEGDEMSIIGYELDVLQLQKNVQFVISAGNHYLWRTEDSLEDILDDDDSRIAPPANSMLSIVVGAVAGETHPTSLSSKNVIAPYSRRGPGFAGFAKPDMVACAGTITPTGVPQDLYSLVLTNKNTLTTDCGTSFAAPVVAGDLAEIMTLLPREDVFLAKALMYHTAFPLWNNDEINEDELITLHQWYGRGLSCVQDSNFSNPHKVTFMRTGTLNRVTKEHVKIFMPSILAAQTGRNIAKVSVTCLSAPPVDRTKGSEYLKAYVRVSLKKTVAMVKRNEVAVMK